MKPHIEILTLLDYAMDKIADEKMHNQVTNHLVECDFCRQILNSHFHLLQNAEEIIEEFFPEREYLPQPDENAAVDTVMFADSLVKSTLERLRKIGASAQRLSSDIKNEVNYLLDYLKGLAFDDEKLVPVIAFLSEDESPGGRDKQTEYEHTEVLVRVFASDEIKKEDIIYEYQGNRFYVIYNNKEADKIKNKKLKLVTNLGSPFVFESKFEVSSDKKNVDAKFELKFNDNIKHKDIDGEEDFIPSFFLFIGIN
jgi:hypothetical protein